MERVQRTVLEECWRPSFARSMIPKYTALRRDLVQYLRFYNFDRAHTGRHTAGREPPSWSMVLERCAHDEPQLSTHPVHCSG